ncbi:hypothetical protein AeMF1_018721 [Aphanomyces euteiches]|nr:hypothetical protein AeMF1_018721 [Aphanomyces euteiches]KAH9166591.1 hypothetical protein AeNC1_018312 [Aphanomyces euteiches]
MLKLFCVLVGHKGSPFPVDIAGEKTVSDLKDMIRMENEKTITCDARELELYMALKDDAWLSDEDPDLKGLSQTAEGNAALPLYIIDERKMVATKLLSKYFSRGESQPDTNGVQGTSEFWH